MKLPAVRQSTMADGVSERNCAEALPACALASFGAVHLAFHPCGPPKNCGGQDIQAKANNDN